MFWSSVEFDLSFIGKLKDDSIPEKWKWVVVKQSGSRPTPRSGLSLAVAPGNKAVCFGGVFDNVSHVDSEFSL